jgi:hypothetical protein
LHAASDPSEDDLVMDADLEGPEGIRFMAADTPIKTEYRPGTNFSMSLSGDDEATLRGYFHQLADGGSVTMPLEKAPWGRHLRHAHRSVRHQLAGQRRGDGALTGQVTTSRRRTPLVRPT